MAVLCAVVFSASAARLHADGTVTGHARFERIKGRPAMGHVELFESDLFLSPDGGTSLGPSFRLGSPPGAPPRGDGFYSLAVPAGTWSILVNQPLFFIAPRVVPGIVVRDGRTTVRNVDLPIDYSTYFTDTWTPWAGTWIQSFTATGGSITGVSWKLAGTDAGEVEASVLRSNGDADPRRWPLASTRASKRDTVAALADNWVRWRSGEVPTLPGETYAVRLSGIGGGFAVFHREKDSRSYAGGRAYDAAGRPQGFDLNVTVFSDNAGTAILYNKTTEGLGALRDGFFAGRWGQTFRATQGTSLAAVDVWAAGAGSWDLDFMFRVRRGGPTGPEVGPAKTTTAAFQAFGAGLHGVSYNPGEVPLDPGETYHVEFTNPEGFNPYVMTAAADAYPFGDAYQSGARRQGVDLSMTVLVYTRPGGTVGGRVVAAATGSGLGGVTVTLLELGRSARSEPDGEYAFRDVPPGAYTLRAARSGFETAERADVAVREGETTVVDLELSAEPCDADFENGGFEEGLRGWSRYGDARGEVVDTAGGGWFAGIRARDGRRFHGNAINGCCLEGGLYQQVCVSPGHRYRVTAWSNIYWIEGSSADATSRLGVAPDGGVDPGSSSISWGRVDRQPREATEGWRRLTVEETATGPVMTVFLDFRQRPAGGDQWRINCFDRVEVADLTAARFRRGDCNGSGRVNLTDAIFLLVRLFQGGPAPPCEDACDTNDDGSLDISDPIRIFDFLFRGGVDLPFPGTGCGEDPDGDAVACERGSC